MSSAVEGSVTCPDVPLVLNIISKVFLSVLSRCSELHRLLLLLNHIVAKVIVDTSLNFDHIVFTRVLD